MTRSVEIALTGLGVDRELRDAIIGDLVEEQAELAAVHGPRFANRWLLGQLVRSAPSLTHAALRAGGGRTFARMLGGAFGALSSVVIVGSASTALVVDTFAPETLVRFAVIALVVDLGYAMAGGYLAARFARIAPLASAAAFGIMSLMLTLAADAEAMGAWYPIALQLLLVPAAVLGGWVRARAIIVRP